MTYPYDYIWERSGDANRHEFQAFIAHYLRQHQIPHINVQGSVTQRCNIVLEQLKLIAAKRYRVSLNVKRLLSDQMHSKSS